MLFVSSNWLKDDGRESLQNTRARSIAMIIGAIPDAAPISCAGAQAARRIHGFNHFCIEICSASLMPAYKDGRTRRDGLRSYQLEDIDGAPANLRAATAPSRVRSLCLIDGNGHKCSRRQLIFQPINFEHRRFSLLWIRKPKNINMRACDGSPSGVKRPSCEIAKDLACSTTLPPNRKPERQMRPRFNG